MTATRAILTRRAFLTGVGGATLVSTRPAFSAQPAGGQRKLVLVLLRGAMDGLAAVPRPDDDRLQHYRAGLVPAASLPLSEGFALHPALKTLHRLYKTGEASFLHAAAGPYRDRSHFLAQDLLESGVAAEATKDGWLNRALQFAPSPLSAVSIGPVTPFILQGAATSTTWSPPILPEADEDTVTRLQHLYENDPLLGPAFAGSINLDAVAGTEMAADGPKMAQDSVYLSAAGRLVAAEGGPDIAVVSLGNWDTHANQGGSLNRRFSALDDGLSALKDALGRVWAETMVCVVTEFGRTVRENGSRGTDHGTGSVAFALGGNSGGSPLMGGRILGDWPGLHEAGLYRHRDLYPANDLRRLFKTALERQFGFDAKSLATDIFPGSADAHPLRLAP